MCEGPRSSLTNNKNAGFKKERKKWSNSQLETWEMKEPGRGKNKLEEKQKEKKKRKERSGMKLVQTGVKDPQELPARMKNLQTLQTVVLDCHYTNDKENKWV